MSTESQQLRKIIEGVLLAAGQPLTVARIAALFDDNEEPPTPAKEEILAVLADIQADCADRGYELKEVGSGWRFQVSEETALWVNRLWEEKPQRYSRALLETLALIAYRQPITRGDIEEIRGVAVSSHIIKSLTEREWIKIVGHRDVPGRPSLYATTRKFLDYFNLSSLEDLPTLSELGDPEKLDPELELDITDSAASEGGPEAGDRETSDGGPEAGDSESSEGGPEVGDSETGESGPEVGDSETSEGGPRAGDSETSEGGPEAGDSETGESGLENGDSEIGEGDPDDRVSQGGDIDGHPLGAASDT